MLSSHVAEAGKGNWEMLSALCTAYRIPTGSVIFRLDLFLWRVPRKNEKANWANSPGIFHPPHGVRERKKEILFCFVFFLLDTPNPHEFLTETRKHTQQGNIKLLLHVFSEYVFWDLYLMLQY